MNPNADLASMDLAELLALLKVSEANKAALEANKAALEAKNAALVAENKAKDAALEKAQVDAPPTPQVGGVLDGKYVHSSELHIIYKKGCAKAPKNILVSGVVVKHYEDLVDGKARKAGFKTVYCFNPAAYPDFEIGNKLLEACVNKDDFKLINTVPKKPEANLAFFSEFFPKATAAASSQITLTGGPSSMTNAERPSGVVDGPRAVRPQSPAESGNSS